MKCKVRLTHTVTLFVEGKSEDQIQDWLAKTTPEEAYLLALDNGGQPDIDYEEDIVCEVSKNSIVDYVIGEEE